MGFVNGCLQSEQTMSASEILFGHILNEKKGFTVE